MFFKLKKSPGTPQTKNIIKWDFFFCLIMTIQSLCSFILSQLEPWACSDTQSWYPGRSCWRETGSLSFHNGIFLFLDQLSRIGWFFRAHLTRCDYPSEPWHSGWKTPFLSKEGTPSATRWPPTTQQPPLCLLQKKNKKNKSAVACSWKKKERRKLWAALDRSLL